MCGIAGIWGREQPGIVRTMVDAMRHRGPDQSGTGEYGIAALGMSRLAILDVSEAGRQPMSTPDGLITIVYNGEVYNFADERRPLESAGVRFTSGSDTEVVLRLYERYGDDFLRRLRGMFALAVLDRRGGPGRERLLLARDQFGIKPLLYAETPGGLVFASEIKAILASGLVQREIDRRAVDDVLAIGAVTQPRTILARVKSLPPAHRMVIDAGGRRVERYWKFGTDRVAGLRSRPYADQVAEVRSAMEESVRLQMVSDVPLGAFLSGGVDSAFLVALAMRHSSQPLRTFSVGFGADHAEWNETADAARYAAHLGTRHTELTVTAEQVRNQFDHFVRGLDQPSLDGLNAYFVSQAARRDLTVALSGTGGDELFAGYPWFIAMSEFAGRKRPRIRSAVKRVLASAAVRRTAGVVGGERWEKRLRSRFAEPTFAEYYGRHFLLHGNDGAARLMSDGWDAQPDAYRHPPVDQDELPGAGPIDRTAAMCLRGYTGNQLLRDIDAVSMAHSLEVRVPFLDPVIADLAMSLSDDSRIAVDRVSSLGNRPSYRESGCKRILIDAAKPYLPHGFDEQPKRGFSFPLTEWLRGPLRELLRDTLSEDAVRRRGWMNPAAVTDLLARFDAGEYSWPQPWTILVLHRWADLVWDGVETGNVEVGGSHE